MKLPPEELEKLNDEIAAVRERCKQAMIRGWLACGFWIACSIAAWPPGQYAGMLLGVFNMLWIQPSFYKWRKLLVKLHQHENAA